MNGFTELSFATIKGKNSLALQRILEESGALRLYLGLKVGGKSIKKCTINAKKTLNFCKLTSVKPRWFVFNAFSGDVDLK